MEIPHLSPKKPRPSPTLATTPDPNPLHASRSLSHPLSAVVTPYPQPSISSPRIVKPTSVPIASHADPTVDIRQLLPDQFPLDDAHSVSQHPAADQVPLEDHPFSDPVEPQFPVSDCTSRDDDHTPSIATAESADPAPAVIKFDPSDDESDHPRDMPAACSQTQLLSVDHDQPAVTCEKSLIDDDDHQVLAGMSDYSQLVSSELSPSDELKTADIEHAAVLDNPQQAIYEEVAAANDPHPALYEEIAAAKDKLEETSVPSVEENGRRHAVADDPVAPAIRSCESETHEPYYKEKENEDFSCEQNPKKEAEHTEFELTPNEEKLAGSPPTEVLEQHINTDDDKQAGIAREASCYQKASTEDDVIHQQVEKVPEDDKPESSQEEVNPEGGKEAEDQDGRIQIPLNESQLTDHQISEVDEEVPESAPEASEAAKSNEPMQAETEQTAEPTHHPEEEPDESYCKQREELAQESVLSSPREVVPAKVEAGRKELTEAELVAASFNQQNSTVGDDHDEQAEEFPELNKQETSHEKAILDGETKEAVDQDGPIELPPNESQLADHEISEFDEEVPKPAPISSEGIQHDEVENSSDEVEKGKEPKQAEEASYEPPSTLSREAHAEEGEDGLGVKGTAESAHYQEEAPDESSCNQREELVQGSILSLSRELAPELLEAGRKELTEDEVPEPQPTEADLIEVPRSQQDSTEADDQNQQDKEFPEATEQESSHKEVLPEGGKEAGDQDGSMRHLADHKISESDEQALESTLGTSETAQSEIEERDEQIQIEEQEPYETGVSREAHGEDTEDVTVGAKDTSEPVHYPEEAIEGRCKQIESSPKDELAVETFEADQEEFPAAKLPEPQPTEAELGKAHPTPTPEVAIDAAEEACNEVEQKTESSSVELEPPTEAASAEDLVGGQEKQTNESIPSKSKPFSEAYAEDSVEAVRAGAQPGVLKDDKTESAVSGETADLNSSPQSHKGDAKCDMHEEEETKEVCTNALIPDAKSDDEGHQKDAPLGERDICKVLLQDDKEEGGQAIHNEQNEESTIDETCPTITIEDYQENSQEKGDVEDDKLLGCTATDHAAAQPVDILEGTDLSAPVDGDVSSQSAPLNIEATPPEKCIDPVSSFSLTREIEFPQEMGEACKYSLTAAKDSPVEMAETYSGPSDSSSEQGTVACKNATADELDAVCEDFKAANEGSGDSVIVNSPSPPDEAAAIDVAGSIRESSSDETEGTDATSKEDAARQEFVPADDDACNTVCSPGSRDFTETVAIGVATHEHGASQDFIPANEHTYVIDSSACPDDTDVAGKTSDCTTNQEAAGEDFIPVDEDISGIDTTSNLHDLKEAAIDAAGTTREPTCDQTKVGEAAAIDIAGECTCDETKTGDAATAYKDAACEDSTPAEDVFVIANSPASLNRTEEPIDAAESTRELPREHTKATTDNNGDDAVCLHAEKDASVIVDGLDSQDGAETAAIDISGSTKDSTCDLTKNSDTTTHEDGSKNSVPADEDASPIVDSPTPDSTAIDAPGKKREIISDQLERRDVITNEDAACEAAIPVVEDAPVMPHTPASLNGTEAASIQGPKRLLKDLRGTQIGDDQLETIPGEGERNTDYTECVSAVTADPGFITTAAANYEDVKQGDVKKEEALPGITCIKEVSDHQLPATAASSVVLPEAGKLSNIVNANYIEQRETRLVGNAGDQEQAATKVDGTDRTEAGGDNIQILKTFKSGKVYPDRAAYCDDDEHKETAMEDPPSTDHHAAVCEGPATVTDAAAAAHDRQHTSPDRGQYDPSAGSSKYSGGGADRPGLLDCAGPSTKFELTQLPPTRTNAKQAEAASDQPSAPTAAITAPPEPKPTSLLEKIIDKVTGKSR